MLTNQERRVEVYNQDCPTRPEMVSPATPTETLNLNWTERDLPERLRTKHAHRLHPYLGKFIPQLVEVFLRKFFVSGQWVLDPFVGSGTTLVQSNELGIHSVGYDISAFNVLLCRAKTANYDLPLLKREISCVLEKTRNALQSQQDQLCLLYEHPAEYIPALETTNHEYLLTWYAPQALQELLTYRHFIEEGNFQYKDILRVLLSRSARSARLTPHYELDFPKQPQRERYWCYKHRRICEPTQEAFKFLERYSEDTWRRVREFAQVRTSAEVQVYHADSRCAEFPPIDGVITSPPYVGLIDYHEQHAYAYALLGLHDLREHEIGSALQGSSEKARQKYIEDITLVLQNALRAMPSGGVMVIIANDKHQLYPTIGASLGVIEEAVLTRHVNRRTGRRSAEFFESIFIWRKP